MKLLLSPLKNENGSMLAIALLMLMLLTLLAISSSKTSTIEILLSGNEKSLKQAFYNTESAYPAVFPLLDDIRNGIDPADFADPLKPDHYPNLVFVGDGNYFTIPGTDFWNEPLDDPDDVTDLASLGLDPGPDVIVLSLLPFFPTFPAGFPPFADPPTTDNIISGVDIDQLDTDMAGESLINRAGYEGLGKGSAGGWVGYYRLVAQGEAGKGSVNQISTYVILVR